MERKNTPRTGEGRELAGVQADVGGGSGISMCFGGGSCPCVGDKGLRVEGYLQQRGTEYGMRWRSWGCWLGSMIFLLDRYFPLSQRLGQPCCWRIQAVTRG